MLGFSKGNVENTRRALIAWDRLCCPRVAGGYLAAHRRLQTRDRLKRWGYVEDDSCTLCNAKAETMNHLFFVFPFSKRIWAAILRWLQIDRPVMDWEHELQWVEQYCRGRSATAEIYRMMMVGSLYYIWQERNARIFQEVQRTVKTITRSLAQDIHCRGNVKKCLKRKLIELNSYPTV
ncbi:uncharacterized protein [Nicotiana sylvestris]|uniref:uncharacterized protein n=1 Tax=Nicotiana sylvestris TaxID=4096 RepID=UPI00388C7D55